MCDQLTDSFGFLWLHAHFISRVDPPMENGANVGWLQLQIYFIHRHHRVATLQLIKDRYNSNSIEQHSQNCVRDRIETDKKHPKCRVIGSHWVSSQWEITR